MNLDDIQAHLDRIFAGRKGSTREDAAMLREALLEFKVGIGKLREALQRTELELGRAREEVTVYARRETLATDIGDEETRAVAEEYGVKARERVDLLERKVIVQRDELQIAEREYDATKTRFQAARHGVPIDPGPSSDSFGAGDDGMSSVEQAQFDRRAREAAVDAQLELLKRKLNDRP